ncbi:MAG: protein-L-isoaspartate(D-aspartate) O-methyltransferase [Pseudomonadales bacterium]|nr:protein-L-isoaspartate(D-aspartate) O-methyltransferase [Pseudomonadales bacterium]
MTSRRTRDRLIERLMDQGINNFHVLSAIRETPRHIFVEEALAHRAYEDDALPIGYKQTLSQPYTVARMSELLLSRGLLDRGPQSRVLEIGAGSGYQTAILAQLAGKVYSVERIEPLLDKARQRMRMLGHDNVFLRHADGAIGWEEAGPFDGILSAAAPEQIPPRLLQQLALGGVLVSPVGGDEQHLVVVYRNPETGECEQSFIEPARFVPFVSGVVRH